MQKVRHTAHATTIAELPDAELPDAELGKKVTVTTQIITSRGAVTALEFGFANIKHPGGKEVSERNGTDVMFGKFSAVVAKQQVVFRASRIFMPRESKSAPHRGGGFQPPRRKSTNPRQICPPNNALGR